MTHSRETSDTWALRAHAILDRARNGKGLAHHIEWALAYLGDTNGCAKIPRDLMGSGRAV